MASVKGMRTVPPADSSAGEPAEDRHPAGAIDGRRRGIRASLEAQTMAMAKATA